MGDPLIRDISDTARWVAAYRARESARPDAVFRDPFANALAGERGERIAASYAFAEKNAWAFVARTYLFDRVIAEAVRGGADVVLNLAAGLDARPYRMDLPKTLRWIEVDLPQMLEYKAEILRSATPVCALERVPVDLADVDARRALFARIAASASRVLVVTEGLLIYFDPGQVQSLARDVHAEPALRSWVLDMCSPALLKMMARGQGGQMVTAGGAPFKWAPPEGPEFFVPLGWRPVHVRSMLRAGAEIKRLPPMLRLFALLPEPKKVNPSRPWSAVVQLERAAT
jgi:methyltransferase (TIGR00027 family)